MEKIKTKIPFNYITVKITKSRIHYGFLTIPVSLTDTFPKKSTNIYLINDLGREEIKHFTPYSSKSRECRIYGLRKFFNKYKVENGDELVIQILEKNKYKIVPEKEFKNAIEVIENRIEISQTDKEVEKSINLLSRITNKSAEEIIKSEFVRLTSKKFSERKANKVSTTIKEGTPLFIRKILLEIYKGKCQISNFTFITKKGLPYFEIHHINPKNGHSFQNLLVVSPNVHAQFNHAVVEHYFDKERWLRKVKFNGDEYFVRQAIDFVTKEYYKEVHFE